MVSWTVWTSTVTACTSQNSCQWSSQDYTRRKGIFSFHIQPFPKKKLGWKIVLQLPVKIHLKDHMPYTMELLQEDTWHMPTKSLNMLWQDKIKQISYHDVLTRSQADHCHFLQVDNHDILYPNSLLQCWMGQAWRSALYDILSRDQLCKCSPNYLSIVLEIQEKTMLLRLLSMWHHNLEKRETIVMGTGKNRGGIEVGKEEAQQCGKYTGTIHWFHHLWGCTKPRGEITNSQWYYSLFELKNSKHEMCFIIVNWILLLFSLWQHWS